MKDFGDIGTNIEISTSKEPQKDRRKRNRLYRTTNGEN